jgi:uncharacterized protein
MLAPLLIGLAGSIHCVGMCGPLILALPLDVATWRRLTARMLLYHSGRILTYMLLGFLFGLLGKGILLAGLQKFLAIFSGFFLILTAFIAWRFEQLILALPGFGTFTRRVQQGLAGMLRRRGSWATLGMGALNGLLPCGMVYAALAGAIAQTSGWGGGIFMGVFGLGTLPLLMVFTIMGARAGRKLRPTLRWLQPALLVLAGSLLLLRGFHLDLSVFNAAVPKAILECH